mgnify:CR=1 FL=1
MNLSQIPDSPTHTGQYKIPAIDTGLGMTAGLSMAFIAIVADRILRGYANSLGTTDTRD